MTRSHRTGGHRAASALIVTALALGGALTTGPASAAPRGGAAARTTGAPAVRPGGRTMYDGGARYADVVTPALG
ncbi:hypothetical protein ACFC1R_35495, partial [Kitasatospora sp. NPDC056138]|uniref:hypothetical protein n=1 Tax=Kitasatospora sp. NPDC056138 TaxID=3345724 RepID=UPI0035E0DBD7